MDKSMPIEESVVCVDAQEEASSLPEFPMKVEGEWNHLKETVLKMKEDVEEDCGKKFPLFNAVQFIKRENRIVVRVHVDNKKQCIDVSLKGQRLESYKLNKELNDLLKFD